MYQVGAHTKYRIMYHIVWIPKYRKRVLEDKIAKKLKILLYECAEINGWKIEELNIQRDHVHILIQLKPSISVSRAVQIMKGGSSRKIRDEFPELKEFYWGNSFWGDGFFAETVGHCSIEVIKEYVRNQ